MGSHRSLVVVLLLLISLPAGASGAEPAASADPPSIAEGGLPPGVDSRAPRPKPKPAPPRQPESAVPESPQADGPGTVEAPAPPVAVLRKPPRRYEGPVTVEVEGDTFRLSGRPPGFVGDAGQIRTGPGQDRRHVLHYSSQIRDPYEKAANQLIASRGKQGFLIESHELLNQHGLLRGSPLAKRLDDFVAGRSNEDVEQLTVDVMKHTVTRLNSTADNLFPDRSFENQGSEDTRDAAARARSRVSRAKDVGEARKIALELIPAEPQGSVPERNELRRGHWKRTRDLVNACPTTQCVGDALGDIELSTMLDLPKWKELPAWADRQRGRELSRESLRRKQRDGGLGPGESERLEALEQELAPMDALRARARDAPDALTQQERSDLAKLDGAEALRAKRREYTGFVFAQLGRVQDVMAGSAPDGETALANVMELSRIPRLRDIMDVPPDLDTPPSVVGPD